jgi:hypothetical protein
VRNRRSAECEEKYLESLQLLRQKGERGKNQQAQKKEQNKQVLKAEPEQCSKKSFAT